MAGTITLPETFSTPKACPRRRFEALPRRAARFVDVYVRIDQAWQNEEICCVNLLACRF